MKALPSDLHNAILTFFKSNVFPNMTADKDDLNPIRVIGMNMMLQSLGSYLNALTAADGYVHNIPDKELSLESLKLAGGSMALPLKMEGRLLSYLNFKLKFNEADVLKFYQLLDGKLLDDDLPLASAKHDDSDEQQGAESKTND